MNRSTLLLAALSLFVAVSEGCAYRRAIKQVEDARVKAVEGKPDEARESYEAALKLDPDLAGVHNALALLYLTQGDPTRATSELLLEIDRHPESRIARFNLALVQIELGRPDEALARLDELAKLEPPDGDHALVRGLALLAKGDRAAARPLLEQAREQSKAAFAPYVLGLSLAAEGRDTEAADALEEAIRRDPQLGAAYLALGLVRGKTGAYKQAITDALPALKILPKDPDAPLVAGMLMLGAQDYTGAREQLSAAVALGSARPGVRNALAVAQSLAGDAKAAEQSLADELAQNPSLAVAHRNRAILLFRGGDLAGARLSFERATQLDPKDETSRDALAALTKYLPES